MTLQEEAEKIYPKNPFWIGSGDSARLYDEFKSQRDAYIAGATSKYVENKAIEFAEWCEANYSYNQNKKYWYKYADKTDDIKPYTTKELLQLWKSQVYYE